MRPHGDTCAAHGAQASDVRDSDNYSVFVVNYYPKTEGITWKPDTNRITPHTARPSSPSLHQPRCPAQPPPCLRLRVRCLRHTHRRALSFAAPLKPAPALALRVLLCLIDVAYWQLGFSRCGATSPGSEAQKQIEASHQLGRHLCAC